MNSIIIGNYTFTDADLMSGNISMEHSVIGETLSADSLVFVVNSKHTGNHKLLTNSLQWYTTIANQGFVIADTSIESIPYATPVSYYIDENMVGQFFVSKIERTARDKFKFTCTSSIGLLITSNHLGGIYNGVSASTVIADILSGVTYTLDASLANASVRGYLPVATKRDNLQQVLFAIGGAVKINASGGLQIVPMSPTVTSEISSDRIYTGGSVETKKTYDGVQLTEHNYFVSQEVETLYDDSITGTELITFNEPHHSFTITGGTIQSSGANYCLVAPTGSASAVVLTGKKYTHVQRIISVSDENSSSNNIMSVKDAYLANPEIAESLAERVWNYAKCNTYIKQNIVVGTERSGDIVKIMNPYTYESVEAVVTNMDIVMSKTNKASTKFLVGYTPEGVVSGFNYYTMITSNCSWYKSGNYVYVNGIALKDDNNNPVEVNKIRIICVGGGGGGKDGTAGSAGGNDTTTFERTYTWSSIGSGYRVSNINPQPGSGGNGGSGGAGGQAGGVFELSLDVANGDTGNMVIGSGGLGGSTPTEGGSTTFSQNSSIYSSADGKKYSYGYVEPKSGLTFAGKGADGKTGGNGGAGSGTGNGTAGGDVDTYTGGNGSNLENTSQGSGETWTWTYYHTYYGSGGGGASGTSNGGNAYRITGGNGANGGNGAVATNYGQGGGGGHGGGGGGGGSHDSYSAYQRAGDWDANVYLGNGGSGGSAGTGGNGKQGCIIIYY